MPDLRTKAWYYNLNVHHIYSKLDEVNLLLSQYSNINCLCLCETFMNSTYDDK